METITQTFEDAVLKTVMFWSDKSFRTTLNQNNGDNSEAGFMTFLLMNNLSMENQKEATEEKIKLFENKLTELLTSDKENVKWGITLSVDYDPCEHLYNAVKFAGLNTSCLPIKTFTTIEKDFSVTAKYQYGGKFIKL